MRRQLPESLDELIQNQAVIVADQIRQAADWAESEEDLRIEVEKALEQLKREAGIDLRGRHEVTLGTGRPDSVYDCVIIEYKRPGKLAGSRDAAGNKQVLRQLKRRFQDAKRELGRPLNTMLGVAVDGCYFIFLRYRDDKWTDQEPVPVDKYSCERFLWALFNLGQAGRPFRAEYLAGDFGAESPLAEKGIRAFYATISETDDPKAQVFFRQWEMLFGEVCGYDLSSLSSKVIKLAQFYGAGRRPRPAALLFALHTYYAIFMKLLANEITAFFHRLPSPLQALVNAPTSRAFRDQLADLEDGSIFRRLRITNFLEGDLFSWYVSAWNPQVEKAIRDMVARLDAYNPGTMSEEPTETRDLLKKLYQELLPKSVRHDLGEYYTPDWLAEHVLNEVGYEGDPDKRLLDPACGSGTFLVLAINRIRRWYDEHREECHYSEAELCRKILDNVIGFDLNPLAVMAARTNYLIALRGLLTHVDRVEIPVYLCDSILTPSDYGGDLLTTRRLGRALKLRTTAHSFLVPSEIARSRELVGRYVELLEHAVNTDYEAHEFIQRCRDEGIPLDDEDVHVNLYEALRRLDAENKNGIWARIIKNAFAPLFVERVDYVAGNPPWVNWENLPTEYRDETKSIWQKYGLFTVSGYEARISGSKKDFSMLFLYACCDQYLKPTGLLGFVITQTVFKTKGAGAGFRRFRIGRNGPRLRVLSVHDMSSFRPFPGVHNRTSTIAVRVGEGTEYPVPYTVWRKVGGDLHASLSLNDVLTRTERCQNIASPAGRDINAPWLTRPRELEFVERITGPAEYQAYAGCDSLGYTGVFWVRPIGPAGPGCMLVASQPELGRRELRRVTLAVERELLYPLLRGRDVRQWEGTPSQVMLLVQDPVARKGIAEATLKRKYPGAYKYLHTFRSAFAQRRPKFAHLDPFYSIQGVGPHLLAPAKVVYREQARTLTCCVIAEHEHDLLGSKPILPDHKLLVIPAEDDQEAHYVCACLASGPARAIAACLALQTSISTAILHHLPIQRFCGSEGQHARLSELSRECHAAAPKGEAERVAALEAEIGSIVASMWGIDNAELAAIMRTLEAP